MRFELAAAFLIMLAARMACLEKTQRDISALTRMIDLEERCLEEGAKSVSSMPPEQLQYYASKNKPELTTLINRVGTAPAQQRETVASASGVKHASQ